MAEKQIIFGPNNEEIEFPANMSMQEIERIMQEQFGGQETIKPQEKIVESIVEEQNAPPIPELMVSEPPRENNLTQQLGRAFYNRPTFQALGGAAGFIGGTPLPGFGNLALSAGGATTGGQLYDLIETLRGKQEPRTLPEAIKSTGKDLTTESAYNLAFASLPGVGQAIKKGITGVTDNSRALFEASKRLNVPLNIAGVTDTALGKGYQKVIGVFPFVGKPIRKGFEQQKEALNKVADNILNSFGPNMSISDLGVNIYKAAKNTNQEFRNIAKENYKLFENAVKKLPENARNVIGLNNTKKIIIELEKDLPTFPLKGGKETIISPAKDEIYNFLQKIKSIKGPISPEQYKGLKQDINYFLKDANNVNVRRLQKTKKALEEDFLSLAPIKSTPENLEKYKEVLTAHKTANDFFAEGMKKFETPTAKRFQRADKNIFNSNTFKSGTINPDELIKNVIKLDSPQAVRDLQKLIPKDTFKNVAQSVVNKAFDSAKIIDAKGKPLLNYDVNKITNSLGITGKSKEKLNGIKEIFKATNVDFNKFQDFIKLASRYQGNEFANPSTFVARRAILGGVRSIPGVAIAAGAVVNLPATAALVIAGRLGSKLLANPKNLDNVMILLNPQSSKIRQYQLAMRAFESLASSKESTNEEKIGFIQMRNEVYEELKDLRRK